MNKVQVVQAALRLYQMVHERQKCGEQLAFTKDGQIVPVVVVGPTLQHGQTTST